jgi:hypothetical protein
VHPTSLPTLIPILQLAVGPVILVSGIGLLLVMLTNRFGRIVDRARLLTRELIGQPAASARHRNRRPGRRARPALRDPPLRHPQRLPRRPARRRPHPASLRRHAARLESGLAAISLFSASLLLLISSLVAFIRDMNLALVAIRTEILRALPER